MYPTQDKPPFQADYRRFLTPSSKPFDADSQKAEPGLDKPLSQAFCPGQVSSRYCRWEFPALLWAPEWDTEVCVSYPQLSSHLAERTRPHRRD